MSQKEAFDHREFLAHVSSKPGVYRMIDRNDKVIYVGKAKNLKKRLASYFRKTGLSLRIESMMRQVASWHKQIRLATCPPVFTTLPDA